MSKIGRLIRLLITVSLGLLSLLSLVGGTFFAAFFPFILIWVMGSADVFTCNHLPSKQTFCQHQSWRLLGLSYQQAEWQLQEARAVVKDVSTMDSGFTYSLSLATSKGEVELPNYWSNKQELDRDVDQFNQLLKGSSQSTFHLRRGYSWFMNIMLFVFIIVFLIPSLLIWYLLFYFFSRLLKTIFRFFSAIATLS